MAVVPVAISGSASGGLSGSAEFPSAADGNSIDIPSWARTIHIWRGGTAITDDATVVLTAADGSVTLLAPAGGVLTPWPITRQGQTGCPFTSLLLDGTTGVATRVFFSAGSYSGPS